MGPISSRGGAGAGGGAASSTGAASGGGAGVGDSFREGVGAANSQLSKLAVGEETLSRFGPGTPKVRSYLKMRSTIVSRAFWVYCGRSRPTFVACIETTGASQAKSTPMERKAIAKSAKTALVRLTPWALIQVTSGFRRYARITAMATGMRIGWRKPTIFATNQMTEQPMVMSRTTKTVVSAAHIILRCQTVGYFVIRSYAELRQFSSASPG